MQYMPPYIEATYKDEATKGDYALKADIARQALLTHPEDRDSLLSYIAVFLQYAKKHEECIEHCRQALPQIQDAECLDEVARFLGYALHSAGRLKEAIEYHQQRLATADDEAEILEIIAKLYEELKDTDNMVLYYELQITEDKDCDAEIHLKLADIYEEKKDFVNACRQFTMYARKHADEGHQWWAEVGRTLALQKKTDEAMFYFKMSQALNPEYAPAHYLMGVAYQAKDDVYRAMHHYMEAIKLQPDYPEVYNNMASIEYHEHSDIKSAIINLEQALQMDVPEVLLTSIYINMIRLHKQIGDTEKQEYYNGKLLESLGFDFGDEDEDFDDDEDDHPDSDPNNLN